MKRQPIDKLDRGSNSPRIYGVDVSSHQGAIDWGTVAKQVAFAVIRTGDGKDLDTRFVKNWKEAGKTSLIRGSYHYFRADRGGKEQAQLVVDAIKRAGGMKPTDLPPAIDIESGTAKNLPDGVLGGTKDLPVALIVDECLEFLDHIEDSLSCTPLVYTGQAFHYWLSQDPAKDLLTNKFGRYPLWVPSYTSQPLMPVDINGKGWPWGMWTIWQYTSEAEVAGISTKCDKNVFRGTLSSFGALVLSLKKTSVSDDKEPETKLPEVVKYPFITLGEAESLYAFTREVYDRLGELSNQMGLLTEELQAQVSDFEDKLSVLLKRK